MIIIIWSIVLILVEAAKCKLFLLKNCKRKYLRLMHKFMKPIRRTKEFQVTTGTADTVYGSGYDHIIRLDVHHYSWQNICHLEINKLQVLTEKRKWNWNQSWNHFLQAQLYFSKATESGIIKRKCHRLSKAKDRQFYTLLDHVLFIGI